VCQDIEIAFVFGGDDTSILMPSPHIEQVKIALLGTKEKSEQDFNLHLRIGAISVQELNKKGISLLVAKHEISKDYKQSIFYGGGMSKADSLIKSDANYCYNIPKNMPKVDFSELECRWQDIPSPKDETLSLLVFAQEAEAYRHLLNYISAEMSNYQQRNPVQEKKLHLSLSLSFSQLAHEAKAKARGMDRYILTKNCS